jgi:DNA repair protein RadD
MTLDLRPYQRESIDNLYDFWRDGGGNGLIVLPTGAGKSLVIATLCRELLESYHDMRIGIVTHVKELVSQNTQELLRAWPGAPVGIYSAGLGRRDTRAKIMFMGIQSVYNKGDRLGDFDMLLIDECHLIPRSSATMYGKFLESCKSRVRDMRIVGLTATPYRLDSGRLDSGPEALFDKIVFEANVRDLIEAGYLSPLISKATLAQIDTSGLHRRAGEFVQSELDERARIPSIVEAAVEEIVAAGQDRAGWIIFCTGVEHAGQVRDAIRRHDITCESVTGDTPPGERDSIIRRYKDGKIRCLTSVGVLTTGFNAPHVDLLAMLRPTLSTGLYVQMVGRAFRLAPGKANALILDFAGNVVRHGPVDAIKPRRTGVGASSDDERGDGQERVMAKACPSCHVYAPLSKMECECGYCWPAPPPRHEARAADDAPILTTEAVKPKRFEIEKVTFNRHTKPGSPDSMRVEFHSLATSFSQWVCFEHQGYARQKASLWWGKMGGSLPAPATVDEALERAHLELKCVVGVEVRTTGKYPEIISMIFAKVDERLTPEDRKRIVEKMKSLAKKTIANGCTEHEFEAASEKLAAMSKKYGIRAREYGGPSSEVPF